MGKFNEMKLRRDTYVCILIVIFLFLDVIGISYTIDCDKKFALDKPEEVHYLDKDNGDLIAPKYKILRPKYCMDMLKVGCGDNKPEPFTLSCLPDLVDIEKIRKKLIVYSVVSISIKLLLFVNILIRPLIIPKKIMTKPHSFGSRGHLTDPIKYLLTNKSIIILFIGDQSLYE